MKRLVGAVALILAVPSAIAQSSVAITLGVMTLELGTPRDAVLEAASRHYVLKNLMAKHGPGPVEGLVVFDGKTPIGNVAFRDGRLLSVFKYWDPPDQQAGVAFAQKFYAAVGSLARDGHRSCTIDTSAVDDPRNEQRVALIQCGHRRLEVSVLRTDEHGAYAGLVEKLE